MIRACYHAPRRYHARVTHAAPLRLVLDTNVWLDGLVFRDAGFASIETAITQSMAHVFISPACEAELARVLGYPLSGRTLDANAQATALAHYRAWTHCVAATCVPHDIATLPRCEDADDQIFLELARDCRADALITKDRALLALR